MSNRVLLIYTGGTIGMKRSDQGYLPDPEFHQVMTSRSAGMLPVFDYKTLEWGTFYQPGAKAISGPAAEAAGPEI